MQQMLKFISIINITILTSACGATIPLGSGDAAASGGQPGAAGGQGGQIGSSGTGGSSSLSTAGTGGACGDPIVKARFPACSAASDAQSCANLGGTWEGHCTCPTGDTDCSCTQASDCAAACLVFVNGGQSTICDGVTVGKCGVIPMNGCFCLFNSTPGLSVLRCTIG